MDDSDGDRGAARGPRRRLGYGAIAVVVAAGVTIGLVAAVQPLRPATSPGRGPDRTAVPTQARPRHIALVSFSGCAALRTGLREHTAASVDAYGLPGSSTAMVRDAVPTPAGAAGAAGTTGTPVVAGRDAAAGRPAAHSGTNDQESGADEPDLVKTDGHRLVTVSDGVLRVIDTASTKITATLDLGSYAGADDAQLLVDGDRALVVLGGEYAVADSDVVGRTPSRVGSTYLLVDLTARPEVISTFRPQGSYVDARLVAGRVRLVVRSAPALDLPVTRPSVSANRSIVRRAPLSAWRPSYDVRTNGVTTTRDVPCADVRHPARYTGASMLTIYTIDPAVGFGDVHPVSLAADAATVYATASSLYVAGQINPFTRATMTQLHRFDIRSGGRPKYLGSATVRGSLLSSYSLSDYDGSLRVVTTDTDQRTPSTSVHVLDADSLRQTGRIDGLGHGQQVYAVRFAGPFGYVVTFRSVDPLYVLDLHDATRPRAAGELHVSGYSTYLHATGTGRLLGVGQDVRHDRVAGVQVALFDVSDPSTPARLDNVVVPRTPGEGTLDPHAFLYWASTGTAVVPIQAWEGTPAGRVLVLHVARDGLRRLGTVANPATARSAGIGIERSLVVGDQLWTMSPDGFAVSDLTTLRRQAWIGFS